MRISHSISEWCAGFQLYLAFFTASAACEIKSELESWQAHLPLEIIKRELASDTRTRQPSRQASKQREKKNERSVSSSCPIWNKKAESEN